MNHISVVKGSGKRRSYESRLRIDQAAATRERILDALLRTMGRGIAELSIPAVAREAGVSVPTVYRHFGTKADLLAALAPYLFDRTGLMEVPRLPTDDFTALMLEMHRRNQAMDAETRAALASQLGQAMRLTTMPQRLAMIRDEVNRRVPGLSEIEADRFTRIVLLLGSSAMTRAYQDYLGLDAREAAEDVGWALDVMRVALAPSD
jgi:AcrR family transcriptional regulator